MNPLGNGAPHSIRVPLIASAKVTSSIASSSIECQRDQSDSANLDGAIWILWKLPKRQIASRANVLSFLSPSEEDLISTDWNVRLFRGRELSSSIRSRAVLIYRELAARISAAPAGRGKTLRQAMSRSSHRSSWWYHDVAGRDSEGSPVFGWIIHILLIIETARKAGATRLELVGAPPGVAATLASQFEICEDSVARAAPMWQPIAIGFAARIRFGLEFLRHRIALMFHYRCPRASVEIALSSFWDWGVKWDPKTNCLVDRYYKKVPDLLRGTVRIDRGKIGYFAWFDPHYEPWQRGRKLRDVLAPLRSQGHVVLLQAFLGLSDLISALVDFSQFRALRRALRRKDFCSAFVVETVDWRPLLEPFLIRGCLNAQVPKCLLVVKATERATRVYRPKLTLTFLEHFTHSRAHYEGVRRAGLSTRNWTMQHAGVCREKLYYFLHPKLELAGEPDGCRVPAPDRAFVMGTLGRDVFLECGYAPEVVVLSGSARYDNLESNVNVSRQKSTGSTVRVLIACSLDIETEIGLAEATCMAARAVLNIQLRLRNHPSRRLDQHPRFAGLRNLVEVSSTSLETDLAWADLVIFTYSTVADEAFIRGTPVWQWLPLGFNGSALAEAIKIPQFGSVRSLRSALEEFVSNPHLFQPTDEDRAKAAERLFFPMDGHAAERIAEECVAFLSRGDSWS